MFATLLLVLAADPVPLVTRIDDVTVYSDTALVHRSAQIERGGGYVFRGLPATLDASALRVRCSGGDVVRVDVRPRTTSSVPEERVQALRERLATERRELQRIQDEQGVVTKLGQGVAQLARLDAETHARDVASGGGDPTGWRANAQFLSERTAELLTRTRELTWNADERTRAIQALERELGGLKERGDVLVHDVEVDVVADGTSTLDLEYLVRGAGWVPAYDLRAASTLDHVALVYRARVRQETGEDWNDVALALSTAQPQRGAQGPEPVTSWVSVYEPRGGDAVAESAAPASLAVQARLDDKKSAGEDEQKPFASVARHGLSARFQLPRRESIPSRAEPATVLVGEASLAIAPERFCAPALDTTVWLRAKATNTSPWALLPGDAAVFLGTDYLGRANVELVQPGQELVLHLGADPALAVTRTRIEDLSKGPAFLSSRVSKVDAWRIRVENHGAAAANADGSVDVIVREALPRARDSRVEVEVTKTQPRWSTDERWKQDREERGIHTWIVRAPKRGAAELLIQTTISYPQDTELARD